jgi:hypothetical protein
LTVSSLRFRAGFFSHRQRSWDSPFGAFPTRKVPGVLPPGCTHLPFRPSVLPPPEGDGPAQTSPGSWVLTLSSVPGGRQGFSSPTAGCSPGVPPSRAFRRKPGPSLHPGSSHTLRPRTVARPDTGVPEYRSALAWHHPPLPHATTMDDTTLLGFVHQTRPTAFERAPDRAMCSPPAASYIAADFRRS